MFKGQGHCDFTEHVFSPALNNSYDKFNKYFTQMSDRIE